MKKFIIVAVVSIMLTGCTIARMQLISAIVTGIGGSVAIYLKKQDQENIALTLDETLEDTMEAATVQPPILAGTEAVAVQPPILAGTEAVTVQPPILAETEAVAVQPPILTGTAAVTVQSSALAENSNQTLVEQLQPNSRPKSGEAERVQTVAWCSGSKTRSKKVAEVQCGDENKIVITVRPPPFAKTGPKSEGAAVTVAARSTCRSAKTEVIIPPTGEIKTDTQTVCKGEDGKWHGVA